MLAPALLLGAGVARAGDPVTLPLPPPKPPTPAAPDARAVCVQKHEEAQIRRRDGQLRAARAALLQCSGAVCPAAIRADCGGWLPEVEKSLPSVVLGARSSKGDESVGRVSVDGELLATRMEGKAIDVDPGMHVFRFEVPPYDPVEQRIVIREGEKDRALSVTLAPQPGTAYEAAKPPPPPLEEVRPVPAAVFVLGGGVLAGLAAFTGLGASGLVVRSSLASASGCAPFCTGAQIQPVRTRFLAADVSLGVAAVAAIAAIVVFVRRPTELRAPSSAPRVTSISLGPGAAGVALGLRGDL